MIFKNIKVVHMLFVQLLSKFKLKVLTGSDSTEKTTTDLSVLLLCGCASYAQYENENKIGIELFHWSWVRHVFFFFAICHKYKRTSVDFEDLIISIVI